MRRTLQAFWTRYLATLLFLGTLVLPSVSNSETNVLNNAYSFGEAMFSTFVVSACSL